MSVTITYGSTNLPLSVEKLEEADGLHNPFFISGSATDYTDKEVIAKHLLGLITGFVESPFEGKSQLFFEEKQIALGESFELFLKEQETIKVRFVSLKEKKAVFLLPDEESLELMLQPSGFFETPLSIGHFLSHDGWFLADIGQLGSMQMEQLKVFVDGFDFPAQWVKASPELGLVLLKVHPLANVHFSAIKLAQEPLDGDELWAQEKGGNLKRQFLDKDKPIPHINYANGVIVSDKFKKIVFLKTAQGLISAKKITEFTKDFGDFQNGESHEAGFSAFRVFKR